MGKVSAYMLIVAIVSLLCVIWAVAIEAYGMAVLLSMNTIVALFFAFRMGKFQRSLDL